MNKKTFRNAAISTMAASATVAAVAPAVSAEDVNFPDLTQDGDYSNPHYSDIMSLVGQGAIDGYESGNFEPFENVDRGQVAKILTNTLDLEVPNNVGKWVADYSDVNENVSYAKEIAAVTKANVFEGNDDESFNTWENIDRQQMAKVIVESFNLNQYDTGDDVDVNPRDVGSTYLPYVQTLANLGITDMPEEFDGTGDLQRDQFASFVVRAQEYVQSVENVDVTANEDGTVSVQGTAPDAVSDGAHIVMTNDDADEDADPAVSEMVDLDEDNNFEFTTDQLEDGNYSYTVMAMNGDDGHGKANAESGEVEAHTVPAVDSVSAINATQVEVQFNKAVDKDDAESGKVSIEGVNTLGNGTLSDDGKTLTLTADNAIDVTNATVAVDPIQTKADKTVETEKYVSVMTYKDEVAPTIESVEAKTSGDSADSLTVKASEPIQSSLAKVDGSYASVNFNGGDTAEINGLSLNAGEDHTIELINLTDKADNETVSTSAGFTVSVDSEAPSATLTTPNSDKTILVTFDKPMNVDKTEAALNGDVVKDESLDPVKTGDASVVADSNGTQFEIPVKEQDIYADQDSRTFNVVLSDSIEDELGNKYEGTTQKVTLTKDTENPVATGYNVVKNESGEVTDIEVNFNEELAGDTNPAEPTIVNENGVDVTSSFLGGLTADQITAGDEKVTYSASVNSSAKVNGKYAFSFESGLVSDQAETANESTAFNHTFNFGEGESVTEFEIADGDVSASSNDITVKFPEAVRGGAVANSATDLDNYTLNGKPLPEGTEITLNDGKGQGSADAQTVATIALPDGSISKDDDNAVFTASNIKNTAGTKTLKSYKGTVEVNDNVKPVLESAKVLDNQTLELSYSEAMTDLSGAGVKDDFIIKNGSNAIEFDASDSLKANDVSGFDDKVKVAIDKDVPASNAGEAEISGTNASIASEKSGTANGSSDINYEVQENVTAPEVTGSNSGLVTKGSENATGTSNIKYNVSKDSSSGNLQLTKATSGDVVISDLSSEQEFTQDGVTFTVDNSTAADGNSFTVDTTETKLKLQDTTNSSEAISDLSTKQEFTQDNVRFSVDNASASAGDKFSVKTVDSGATSKATLDLNKDITVETKDSTVIKDASDANNQQKADVKVTAAE